MKTAIVTGGAQGIGKATAMRLRADGWRVAVFDLDDEALGEVDDDILALHVDVGNENDVSAAFASVRDWLGDSPLDLLVSNAGVADPVSGPIEELSLEGWRRWQDSHVTGAFLCIRAAVPLLRAGGGSIVTMASTRALQSEPETEAYAAAKGALVALTHALAVSLGPEIRVNTILPGWIETAPGRSGRSGRMSSTPMLIEISIPWDGLGGLRTWQGWWRGLHQTRPGLSRDSALSSMAG